MKLRITDILNLPFVIFVFTFLTIPFLDRLIPEGMFFDGLVYSSVGRNMSEGTGSFWNPVFDAPFRGHPPLAMWLQSLFFRFWGDHFYTEKVYCFVVWAFTVFMIIKIWKTVFKNDEAKNAFWLPLLLWYTIPTVLWGYANNVLENTMGVFDLIAVFLIFSSFEADRRKYLYLGVSGICITLASLSKGFPGLFPLAVPLLGYMVLKKGKWSTTFRDTAILVLPGFIFYAVALLFPSSSDFIREYLNIQVISSLKGENDRVDSVLKNFSIVLELFIQLSVPIVLSLTFFLINKKKKWVDLKGTGQSALFFILVGLSASLPVALSIKQRSFYLIPSMPYFCIGLAIWISPVVVALMGKYRISAIATRRLLTSFAVIIVALIGYVSSRAGSIGREKELIHDLKILQKTDLDLGKLGVCDEQINDYELQAYAQRYLKAKITDRHQSAVILIDRTKCPGFDYQVLAKPEYEKINLPTQRIDLYKKITQN